MNQIVQIGNQEVQIKELNKQRVVTFKDIDRVHERPSGTASRNFITNRKHLLDGEDFYLVKPSDFQNNEFRCLGFQVPNRGLTLITESGYLMLVKSFTDDLAWKVQRQLVNCYFRVKEEMTIEITEKESLSRKEKLKVAEILSQSPRYNLKAVIDVLKPYLSKEVVESYVNSEDDIENNTSTVAVKIPNNFHKKLTLAIHENNLTQSELAEKVGYSKGTIHNYVHGKTTPNESRISKIAEVLNVNFYE